MRTRFQMTLAVLIGHCRQLMADGLLDVEEEAKLKELIARIEKVLEDDAK